MTDENRRWLLPILLGLIFAFWFSLTRDNFFHWDEWAFLLQFDQNPITFLTKSYGEHYIPLNLLHHYLLFKIFGLNNLPFQVSVILFHIFNTFLLYKMILKKTTNVSLAILGLLISGISNVYVEDVIWSQGISNVASATFIYLAYYLHVILAESRISKKLSLGDSGRAMLAKMTIIAFCLLISPLWNDLGLLVPFAFIFMVSLEYLVSKKINWKYILFYLSAGVINLLVFFYFSGQKVSQSTHLGISALYKVPQFVTYGIIRGNLVRFFYPGFHFMNGGQQLKEVFIGIISIIGVIIAILYLISWLYKKTTRNVRLVELCTLSSFALIGYFTASLGRISYGLSQAGISRYTYPSFFFIILLAVVVLNNFPKIKQPVFLLGIFFFFINVIAVLNFQYDFWGPMVNRDRQFVIDANTLLNGSEVVYDLPAKGIYPEIKLSKLWFLLPKNKEVSFIDAESMPPTELVKNNQEIYKRFIEDYSKKFD